MKRIGIILVIGLASCVGVIAQATTGFYINFGTNPPPHTVGVPDSGAQLNGDSFYAAIYLSDVQPTSGRIAEIGQGGGLTTLFNFTNLVFAAYPPPPGAVAFSYEQSWQLTDSQIQNLLAGQWFVEVSYTDSSFVGEIVPIPEPSSVAVSATGLILLAVSARRRGRR